MNDSMQDQEEKKPKVGQLLGWTFGVVFLLWLGFTSLAYIFLPDWPSRGTFGDMF